MKAPPRILTIAGSDSSGGAGIQADIKTITMLGGYAMSAITALTAQNTLGVTRVDPVAPEMVAAQIDACLSDIGADAIKIGMLGSPEVAHLVADRLDGLGVPIVFDPVMVATSGAVLADKATVAAFERLMRIATVTTPNLPELAALSGMEVSNEISQGIAARAVMDATKARALLAKGGHWLGTIFSASDPPRSTDGLVFDVLYSVVPEGYISDIVWEHERIDTVHTHGTGCTLASAVATYLGHGLPLDHAIGRGREFVLRALQAAPCFGGGHGPLGHQAGR